MNWFTEREMRFLTFLLCMGFVGMGACLYAGGKLVLWLAGHIHWAP